MKKILSLLLAALLCLTAAQAKTDVNKILGRLADVGVQAVQQADLSGLTPLEAVQAELNGIKESYKQEGRAYAKELGDIMMERALANKKVDRTLDSVRALCWGVVAYITVISFLLFGMMLRINALLGQLRAENSRRNNAG